MNHKILPSWLTTEICERKEREEENVIGMGRKTKWITEFRKAMRSGEEEGRCLSLITTKRDIYLSISLRECGKPSVTHSAPK